MPAQYTKSIALTAKLEAWIDALVEEGEYRSASEVVREALRAMQKDQDRRAAELLEIQARIAGALAQADRGKYAEGTGEEAISRAFRNARKQAGQ